MAKKIMKKIKIKIKTERSALGIRRDQPVRPDRQGRKDSKGLQDPVGDLRDRLGLKDLQEPPACRERREPPEPWEPQARRDLREHQGLRVRPVRISGG